MDHSRVLVLEFLPSLSPGEAAIIGVDFPIPLTIQIEQPPELLRPNSAGPQFSKWLQPQPSGNPVETRAADRVNASAAKEKDGAADDDFDDDIPF